MRCGEGKMALIPTIHLAIATTRAGFQQHCPTMREALIAAIELEELMSCFHADRVAVFESPRYQTLFKAMMAADNDHVGALRNVLSKWS